MRIAVSGADGFLGIHLLDALQFDGEAEVIAITRHPDKLCARFPEWSGLKIIEAGCQADACTGQEKGPSTFVACAFPRAGSPSAMAAGLAYVYETLHWARECGFSSVVNISSQSVYSPSRTSPAKEDSPLYLADAYAASKYCVELSVAELCKSVGMAYTNIRLASLVGPGFDQRVPNKLLKRMLAGEPVTITAPTTEFDYLDVRDAAAAVVKLVESDRASWRPVYNVGASKSATLMELAYYCQQAVEALGLERPMVIERPADGERKSSALDSGLFSNEFSWGPKFAIQDTIRSIAENLYSKE